jgi:hypothetical protein
VDAGGGALQRRTRQSGGGKNLRLLGHPPFPSYHRISSSLLRYWQLVEGQAFFHHHVIITSLDVSAKRTLKLGPELGPKGLAETFQWLEISTGYPPGRSKP